MIIIKLYLLLAFLVIVHELAHLLFLRIYKVNICSIEIGNIIFLRLGKIKISPFIFSGSIKFSEMEFNSLALNKQIMIILSGIISSLLIFLIIPEQFYFCKMITLIYLMISCLPIPFIKSDTYILLKTLMLHLKKYYSKKSQKK